MSIIAERLAELGIKLPNPASPSANYVPARIVGSFLLVSGQVPTCDGKDQFIGKLGGTVSLADGQAAARLCALNLLAQASKALHGELDRIICVVRLGGFVNAVPEFGDHPNVLNGASDLMVEVFGDAGRHVRVAVGCASLPRNVPVEVEGLFQVTRGSG